MSFRDVFAADIDTQSTQTICNGSYRAILNYRCKKERLSSQVDRLKDAGNRFVKSFWWWGDDDDDILEDTEEEVCLDATGSCTTADCVCSSSLWFWHGSWVKTSSINQDLFQK